jgi:hypothetical protein
VNDTSVRATESPVNIAVLVVAGNLSVDGTTAILPDVLSPPRTIYRNLNTQVTLKNYRMKLWIVGRVVCVESNGVWSSSEFQFNKVIYLVLT